MVVFLPVKPRVAFYGNNSHGIGAGHIMRLYALAQAAQVFFDITFIYKTCSLPLLNKLHQANFNTQQIAAPLSTDELLPHAFTAIIVDDYDLTTDEWLQLNQLTIFIVKLDDALDHQPIWADFVINPAPNVSLEEYRQRAPNATFCLGPQYTYLRKEFAAQDYIPIAERPDLLIALGGTDPKSLALPLSRAIIDALPEAHVCLLIGQVHQQQRALELLAKQHSNFSIICNPPSVAQIMMQSGLAISAAGGTLGELASQGVPTLALVTVDNQLPALGSPLNNSWYYAIDTRAFDCNQADTQINNDLLSKIKVDAVNLWHDKCLRQDMSDIARQLIDSQGCQRIIRQLIVSIQQKSEL
jgi:UDP-2,4-diacetamido-2,4,6-trideoxy-beta-L-altropyranose hydrolase